MDLKNYCTSKVKAFRDAVGLTQNTPELHRKLFDEEQQEFYDAESDADVADALADMIFIWCGAMLDLKRPIYRDEEWFWSYVQYQAQIAGINLKGAFDLVYESNMSKLCIHSEIYETIHKYDQIGVLIDFKPVEHELFAAYSAYDQTGKDGKEYPEGKLLKSCRYHEPDWSKESVWRIA